MKQTKPRQGSKARKGTTDIEVSLDFQDLYQFPDDVIRRLLAGEFPLKIIREHRAMTLEALASQIHVSVDLLMSIEREYQVFPDTLRLAAADVLNVDARALIRIIKAKKKVKKVAVTDVQLSAHRGWAMPSAPE